MSLGRTFLNSVSVLMSGTVAAQAITFTFSLLLTRLYAPKEFGQYSLFLGFAGVVAAIATGAFDRVILLADSDEESRRVATLTMASSASVSLIVAIVVSFLALLFPRIALPLPWLDVILFLPLFILSYGAAQVMVYSSLRYRRVGALASLKVAQSSVMGLVQWAAASLSGVSGLILGAVAGWSLLAAAGLNWRRREAFVWTDLQPATLIKVSKRHWRYPRYIMPNEALDNLSNQVPVFAIGTLLSLTQAGYYGIAIMMLSAPAALAGQAVGQSFMQYLGQGSLDGPNVRWSMIQIWAALAAVGFIPFGAILVVGPEIFAIGFGESWRGGGEVAQALSLLMFVRFVSSPTSTIYLRLGMQQQQWWFCIAAAIYRTAAYSTLVWGVSVIIAILLHVIFECAAIILYNYVALRKLRLPIEG